MRLDQHSYRTHSFRPQPLCNTDHDDLTMIITPWGQASGAERVTQVLRDFLYASMDDSEVTSPFQKLSCLSPIANNLRVALMLANDAIYNELNREEYISGVEAVIIMRSRHELAFAQVGFPMIYLNPQLKGSNQSTGSAFGYLQNVSGEFDLSFEHSKTQVLPPLPGRLLGADPQIHPVVNSIRMDFQNKLLFLSRSGVPPGWPQLAATNQQPQLDLLVEALVADDPEVPFWIGMLEL